MATKRKNLKKIAVIAILVAVMVTLAIVLWTGKGTKCSSAGPVCGFDGTTYESECKAIAAGVPGTVPGACTGQESSCPRTFAAVCGKDGNTYQNECRAKAVGAQIDHLGICINKVSLSDCPQGYGPVCGKDGVTYESTCAAGKSNIAFIGNCSQKEKTVITGTVCQDVQGFICGKNGMTFQNACLASSFGVGVVGPGYCK